MSRWISAGIGAVLGYVYWPPLLTKIKAMDNPWEVQGPLLTVAVASLIMLIVTEALWRSDQE